MVPLRRVSDHTPLVTLTPVVQIEEAIRLIRETGARDFFLYGRASGIMSAHFGQGHIDANQFLEFNDKLSEALHHAKR